MQKTVSVKILIYFLICTVLFTAAVTFLITSSLKNDEKREEKVKIVKETVIAEEEKKAENTALNDKLQEIGKIIDDRFYYPVDEKEFNDLVAYAVMTSLGDRYADYMNAEELDQLIRDQKGNYQGIGITVMFSDDGNGLDVVNVTPNSPAEKSGVEIGDVVIKAAGQPVSELGYDNAVSALRGVAGTTATFTVRRKVGGEEVEIEFEILREEYDAQTVLHKKLDGGVGYIRITEFNGKTPEQFSNALNDLLSQGNTKFVFDLRGNPGGTLNSITEILDTLLPEGPIIRMIDKNGNEEKIESDANELNYPFAILVNGNTASAAELFTSAMRDYNKAQIFGEQTFGKGSVQITVTLSDGSAIKFTHQLYSPPFSDNYDGVGITPDLVVSLPEEYQNYNVFKIPADQDTQLAAAVEYLNSVSK